MVRKALKWMFYLWLLAGILPLAGSWASRTVSTWSSSRPTPAAARISELAEELDAGQLSADDLAAALEEIAALQDVEEASPAPPEPEAPPPPARLAPTSFEDTLGRVAEAAIAANKTTAPPPTTPADVEAAAAAAESAIAELDALYGEWIGALEAVQEAQTDEWERRWARDRVTTAKGDRIRGIRDLRLDMTWRTMQGTPFAERRKLEGTAPSAARQQVRLAGALRLSEERFASFKMSCRFPATLPTLPHGSAIFVLQARS